MEEKKALVSVQHPWLVMASMMIGAFVGMLSETSLNIALPQFMKAFNINAASVQWLVTGYMLVIGIVLPFSSLLTKWFTTRQIVIFGLTDFIVGAAISALAPNFGILLLGRMIQGIGTGLILPLMFTVVMLVFAPQKLGAAMGVCSLVIMLAPAVGPTLTGLILGKLSWNWIFWLFIPFLAIALLFAIFGLKNVGKITRPHVDLLSLLESVVGFSAIVMGVSFASELGWTSWIIWVLLIVGLLVLTLYARRQLKLTEPILNLRVFKKTSFTLGALCVMLDFSIILSAMYLLPQYLQQGLLLPVALTGIILLPGGIINALTSAIAGRLYDKLGAKKPAILGFLIAIVGVVMLLASSAHSTIAYIIAAHVVLMIGCPLAMAPSQTHALNSLSGLESADGSTILNTMQQIVGAVATALATSFLSLGQNAYQGANAAARFTNGIHFGLFFTLVLAILGLILALGLGKKAK
ncbi:DHA2 family efflux MFS transporter permease subunit [Bombilactobacillus thymidiniphilus]|uniref:DHA2 family efflux MFS transporter permease subunit n=1 Tax=Bombilactobacillus thymidiniphilus TaxID=2923363 RepID=A0ABY4PEX8_9LACO|nr:DHA2 family efflux MFS transporter permease subunit [Bombilactobacillus thymidiniphilus]UQS84254.1 DHA2 family efflux MFS transporter permease subunit [Bombilactobacillus thymidiniphilus]